MTKPPFACGLPKLWWQMISILALKPALHPVIMLNMCKKFNIFLYIPLLLDSRNGIYVGMGTDKKLESSEEIHIWHICPGLSRGHTWNGEQRITLLLEDKLVKTFPARAILLNLFQSSTLSNSQVDFLILQLLSILILYWGHYLLVPRVLITSLDCTVFHPLLCSHMSLAVIFLLQMTDINRSDFIILVNHYSSYMPINHVLTNS